MKIFAKKKVSQSKDIVLEQWKTCVEMANSIAEKRNVANGFYITINTAILAIMNSEFKNNVLPIIGTIICFLWFFSIKSYVKLSKVKYELINDMEKDLPYQPFTNEWKKLNSIEKYRRLTWFERCIPIVFIVLFLLYIFMPIFKSLIEALPCLTKNIV